jgi:hypothetical protein
MAMRAKALVGVCEAVLAEVVATSCPQLRTEDFVVACMQNQAGATSGTHNSLQEQARGSVSAAKLHCALCRSLWGAMQELSEEFPAGRLALLKKLVFYALLDAEAAHDPGAELRALLITRVILEIEGLVSVVEGKMVWDASAKVSWCLAPHGLGPREERFSQRMAHMRRNTFVTRSLLGCTVVVDPVATWEMAWALF